MGLYLVAPLRGFLLIQLCWQRRGQYINSHNDDDDDDGDIENDNGDDGGGVRQYISTRNIRQA